MKKTKRARRQRRGRVSIRWKTLSVLGVFALTMIGLLWLFQIVLLDDFYIAIKKNAVSKALAEATASLAESEDYASALDELAQAGELKPGMRVLAVGFGGGLTWAGTLFKW